MTFKIVNIISYSETLEAGRTKPLQVFLLFLARPSRNVGSFVGDKHVDSFALNTKRGFNLSQNLYNASPHSYPKYKSLLSLIPSRNSDTIIFHRFVQSSGDSLHNLPL